MRQGLIHIYHGDGKGKTTAAMGLALRALGCGWRVGIVQFLKGSASGEIEMLQGMSRVTILRGKSGDKFSFQMNEEEKAEAKRLYGRRLIQTAEEASKGAYDLLILDEALSACGCGLLCERELLDFIRQKPQELELVLTGRNPSETLLASADYVTEMRMQKHPFERGMTAREGVEY